MPTIAEIIAAKNAAAKGHTEAAAQPAKKPSGPGMILRASEDPERAEPTPPQFGPSHRSLSTTSGEDIPMTPVGATPDVQLWHSALQAFDTTLCLVHDQDPRNERAWIAVRRPDLPNDPIFLFPLPLYPHPKPLHIPGEPF